MSHHSSDKPLTAPVFEEFAKMEKPGAHQLDERTKAKIAQLESQLGPTGSHPHGRLVPHDEGGLMFGVTVFQGRVIFDFGKPIRSIGFTREGALELAELIKQRAMQCPPIIGAKRVG